MNRRREATKLESSQQWSRKEGGRRRNSQRENKSKRNNKGSKPKTREKREQKKPLSGRVTASWAGFRPAQRWARPTWRPAGSPRGLIREFCPSDMSTNHPTLLKYQFKQIIKVFLESEPRSNYQNAPGNRTQVKLPKCPWNTNPGQTIQKAPDGQVRSNITSPYGQYRSKVETNYTVRRLISQPPYDTTRLKRRSQSARCR